MRCLTLDASRTANATAKQLLKQGDDVVADLVRKPDFYVAPDGTTYAIGDTSLTGTIKSNWGNSYNVTPEKIHGVVEKNPGIKKPGIPNSSLDILNSKGELATRRYYDNNGKVYRDVDMTHHGNIKQHPEAPHEHIWKFDNNGNKIGR